MPYRLARNEDVIGSYWSTERFESRPLFSGFGCIFFVETYNFDWSSEKRREALLVLLRSRAFCDSVPQFK
jgi:hypothetical protein